ncbi:hypothetical protein [uncultured Jatrophihabitans sp.]|uniref:hypothetical protein n=1 Tax=uncultured Jatrophihabitans sp. TaxID=1610747 RepID=UPI0035C9AC2B
MSDAVEQRAMEERAADELAHDRRAERLLLWKGLAALVLVVIVAYVRHRYLV